MISRRTFTFAQACLISGAAHAAKPSPPAPQETVLQVGPRRRVKTLKHAARVVKPGTVVEVDAGTYAGDVAVWTQPDISLRAVGGRVRLLADGAAAEGKGIWVVRAPRMRVTGFDFEGARVPDRNGAGIRLDKGSLRVHDCRFLYNEMGLLTNNDPTTRLEVEGCEFGFNQRPDGHNHNLYAGRIASLSVTGSYFHHARTGHLLKSRAAVNTIRYNRLTDEAGGTASYELEFPDGGLAIVLGNVIGQSADTENRHMISFGAESYHWTRNALYLAHNTLIDPLGWGGIFLRVARGPTTVMAVNNLLVGRGNFDTSGDVEFRNNLHATADDFVDMSRYDCRLRSSSRLIGRAAVVGEVAGTSLQPTAEYRHPRMVQVLENVTHNPGATQSIA